MRFFLGRLNLYGLFASERRQQLCEALESGKEIHRYNNFWAVTDMYYTGSADENEFEFAVGRLTRYHDTVQRTIDNETKREKDVEVPGKIFGEGLFIIHLPSLIMAYAPNSGIRERSFRRYFAELIMEGLERFMIHAEVDPILEGHKFIEEVQGLDKVSDIDLVVRPSNPGYKDQWKEVDEELQEENIEDVRSRYRYKENQKASIKEGSFLRKILLMVSDGYGSAKATGEKDGEFRTIRSEKSIKTVEFGKNVPEESFVNRIFLRLQTMASEQKSYEGDT